MSQDKELTANLTINIDSEHFYGLLSNTLLNLPKEKIEEIVLGALSEFIKNNIKNIFFTEGTYRDPRPTALLENIIGKMVPEVDMEQFSKDIFELLKNNYKELIILAMSSYMANQMFGQNMQNNYNWIQPMVTQELQGLLRSR